MDGLPEIPGGRMEGEGVKAFAHFTVYREMGPRRTLEKAAASVKKSASYMADLSSKWSWRERVEAWDDYADLQDRKRDLIERDEARKSLNRDHGAIGNALLAVASKGLAKYDGETEAVEALIAAMTPGEIAALVREGVKTSRLAMGESTERLEVREAAKYADRLIDVALTYIPESSHEAFLTDLDAVLGVGTLNRG